MSAGVPDRVLCAFEGRASLSMPELAEATEIDAKTLRAEIAAGTLPWHKVGRGTLRQRRAFTLRDVEEFYRRTGQDAAPCPSTSIATLPAGSLISNVRVIDFTAQQTSRKRVLAVKRKRSRRKNVGRPTLLFKKSSVQPASP